MPPETPASTNPIPRSLAAACRRWESWKLEFPPSTITSPGAASPSRVSKVSSVTGPAGTIIQNDRGAASWSRSSARVFAVDATPGSYVFTSCPRSSSRFAMLPPMRPRPIIPSCIYASSR